MSIGMMLTPVIVGWSHDVWKTYDWSLYVMAGFLCGGERDGVVCYSSDGAGRLGARFEARRSLKPLILAWASGFE